VADAQELIGRFCGGRIAVALADRNNPSVTVV
jgi:hypothetical protein